MQQTQHIIDWLKTKPNTIHNCWQIDWYAWLQTGVWGSAWANPFDAA